MTQREHQFTDATKRGSGVHVSQDALFALIGDDETIRRKMKLLVNMMLEMGFQIMMYGTPTERINYSKSVLPSIIRASTQTAGGEVAGLRAEMQDMFREMMGEDVKDAGDNEDAEDSVRQS